MSCIHGCKPCNYDTPLKHEEKVVSGAVHFAILPACHPNAQLRGYTQGRPSEIKKINEGVTKKRSDNERVAGI
jgi:hypothetical protein